jgi:hypothetical protein
VTESLRPAVQTHCTPGELYRELGDAWVRLCGSEPTRASLLVLLAHWALETGFGHSCWNWNFGNSKHVAGDGRDFYQIRCNEVVNGVVVWLDPPNPGCSFRAFDSIAAGVVDYLTLLRGQFGFAWPHVEAGDPAAFCHALKQRGYYTADEALYTAGVVRCYHQLEASIPATEAPTLTDIASLNPAFVPPDPVEPTPPEDLTPV